MNTIDAISKRRSIRKFHNRDIPEDLYLKIFDAGIHAPSSKNRQPWKYIVIRNSSRQEMVNIIKNSIEKEKSGNGLLTNCIKYITGAEYTLKIMEEAPLTIFVENTDNRFLLRLTEEEKLNEIANIQSIGASIQNMILAAQDLGIGSLWICDIFFAYKDLCKWLNITGQLIAAVSFGYPNEAPYQRPRNNLSDVIEWK
jgi:nitroreductase